MVIAKYKGSSACFALAASTRLSYQRALDVLSPFYGMPLTEIDRPFVVALREAKIFFKTGRWMANYVVTVPSILFEYAIEETVSWRRK